MEYQDYDLLLKYQIEQERRKSSYVGDPSIYEDGRELEIFPDGKTLKIDQIRKMI